MHNSRVFLTNSPDDIMIHEVYGKCQFMLAGRDKTCHHIFHIIRVISMPNGFQFDQFDTGVHAYALQACLLPEPSYISLTMCQPIGRS
jgi:hypothetical protein